RLRTSRLRRRCAGSAYLTRSDTSYRNVARVSPKVRDAGISCSVTASQTYTEIEPRLRRSRAAIYSPWRSDRAESENHTLGVERGRPDTWMQPGGRAERVERHASLESICLDPAAQFPTRSRADLVPL